MQIPRMLVVCVLVGLVPVGSALAADPAVVTITPDGGPATWQGAFTVAGANVSNAVARQLCPGDPGAVPGVHECDVLELTVSVPPGFWDTHKGGVSIAIDWDFLDPTGSANDFDMYVFRKPPSGEPVANPLASSAQGATTEEHALLYNPEGTYLVRVNPFLVAAEGYRGRVEFFSLDAIPEAPGGLRTVRASSTGFLSYSEPHIAIDPLDSNHLVAGSKMYQNLEAYRFKIGTFVSFDGGRSWTDNGHLPGYPAQTGSEADYYITSDVWTAFDDEGNAYAMVLDNPANSATGAGWGMSLHKSTDGGRTWSGPIPIHRNSDPVSNLLFLDDKNTLAVDNYGPDRDGITGHLYACWSFDAFAANLAVFVSRSTDGGLTWSVPQNVSGTDRQVIGCHVVIGPPLTPGGPGVVYVFWLRFAGDGTIRMTRSVDGGETFAAPTSVRAIRQVPRKFPNSEFRNLSLPSAGVDPGTGTVYVSWADYHATIAGEPCPPDAEAPAGQVCDADILLVRSADRGATWSEPLRVNQDPLGNGKDQFQQALAVTPRGQLTMMWFDRRNDPQNFYIDTFFARSNDGGQAWTETRVTRTMWDPSVNPPISPSGHFIGDYQGIVATDEVAIPFWNDTTLANLDSSNPKHSPFQEAFSARIPNTRKFGGP